MSPPANQKAGKGKECGEKGGGCKHATCRRNGGGRWREMEGAVSTPPPHDHIMAKLGGISLLHAVSRRPHAHVQPLLPARHSAARGAAHGQQCEGEVTPPPSPHHGQQSEGELLRPPPPTIPNPAPPVKLATGSMEIPHSCSICRPATAPGSPPPHAEGPRVERPTTAGPNASRLVSLRSRALRPAGGRQQTAWRMELCWYSCEGMGGKVRGGWGKGGKGAVVAGFAVGGLLSA
eukprot:352825-Chlamydomonas_euryale.AAC.19